MTLRDNLEPLMQGWLVDSIMNNLEAMFSRVQGQTASLQDALTQSPSSYAGGSMWNTAVDVAGTVMTPIAALVLLAVFCIEIIGWVEQRNKMHDSIDLTWMFFELMIKIIIGVYLVQNAPKITDGIFQFGAEIVSKISGDTGGSFGTAADLASMRALLEEKDIGYLVSMLITSLFGQIGIMAITIIIQVTVIGRIFKICLYASMGAVPYATLMQKELSDIGKNYIKNLFALAFQGFFMFTIVVMYQALTRNITVASDPNEAVFTLLLYSVVFVFALFNTSALSKSVFNAH
ncbi:MAG TPA: CD0415/CD1112 family protein [Clostridia bacterium]|nr:CD0415/CD1112 family protein [Clostridia bacterium]